MARSGSVVWLCALALLCFGAVMVSSAGMSIDAVPIEAPEDAAGPGWKSAHPPTLRDLLQSRPVIHLGFAMIALTIAAFMPVARALGPARDVWVKRPVALLGLCVAGMLAVLAVVYLPGIGRSVNGSARWVNLPVVGSAQPSELVKWTLPIALAFYVIAIGDRIRSLWTGLAPGAVALALVAGFVGVEDLGTAVLVGAVGGLVLLAGGARLWHFLPLIPAALGALYVAVAGSPYRIRRLETFIDPFADPAGDGYHIIQSMSSIAGGGPFGRGLGHGLQKFGYLPE
ncbi:MAG: FtsW/RodA/SpoVE family cell cycle protein, partial [Planctomycetota bacterium]